MLKSVRYLPVWAEVLTFCLLVLVLALLGVVISGCSSIDHGNIPIVDLSIPI